MAMEMQPGLLPSPSTRDMKEDGIKTFFGENGIFFWRTQLYFLCILTIFHCIPTKIHRYTIFLCIRKGPWNIVCILVYSIVFLSIFYLPSVFYYISAVFSAPPKTVCVFLLYSSVFSKLYSLSVFEYILICIKKYIESGGAPKQQ